MVKWTMLERFCGWFCGWTFFVLFMDRRFTWISPLRNDYKTVGGGTMPTLRRSESWSQYVYFRTGAAGYVTVTPLTWWWRLFNDFISLVTDGGRVWVSTRLISRGDLVRLGVGRKPMLIHFISPRGDAPSIRDIAEYRRQIGRDETIHWLKLRHLDGGGYVWDPAEPPPFHDIHL